MTKSQATAFDQLVQQWLSHENLRSSGAAPAALIASRQKLDAVRRAARSIR